MTAKRKSAAKQTKANTSLAMIVDDVLHILVALQSTKHADPAIAQRMVRLDAVRRQLQRDEGMDETPIDDANGIVEPAPSGTEEK